MRYRLYYGLLAAEAALCAGLGIAYAQSPVKLTSALEFPFAQIAAFLRALSLKGATENGIALAIYAAICLMPLVILGVRALRGRARLEDGLLAALSGALGVAIYIMINPGWLPAALGVELERAFLGVCIYSVFLAYIACRFLRLMRSDDREGLIKHLKGLLLILGGVFIFIIAGAGLSRLIDAFTRLSAGNTAPEARLGLTRAFLVMGYVNKALPYALDMPVICAAARLLDELRDDQYGEGAAKAAETLSRRCVIAIAAGMLSGALFNALQFVFAPRLLVIDAELRLPFASLIIAMALLVAARYIRAGRRLREDNELFI